MNADKRLTIGFWHFIQENTRYCHKPWVFYFSRVSRNNTHCATYQPNGPLGRLALLSTIHNDGWASVSLLPESTQKIVTIQCVVLYWDIYAFTRGDTLEISPWCTEVSRIKVYRRRLTVRYLCRYLVFLWLNCYLRFTLTNIYIWSTRLTLSFTPSHAYCDVSCSVQKNRWVTEYLYNVLWWDIILYHPFLISFPLILLNLLVVATTLFVYDSLLLLSKEVGVTSMILIYYGLLLFSGPRRYVQVSRNLLGSHCWGCSW